jgi:hypothetical protein
MRNRLLVSAAILAAGVAVASGQHAPDGAVQDRGTHNASRHSQSHAAEKTQPQRTRTAGSLPSRTGDRQNKGPGAENRQKPPQRDHGERRGGTAASDRSIWDRAMAQGRLQSEFRSEPARNRDDRRRQVVRRPGASAASGDRASAKDHARSQPVRRRPEQAMDRADERDLKVQLHKIETRKTREHAQAPAPHDNASLAGQADVRKAQTALNQRGFNVGDPDGKLGPQTKKALIAFQKQHGFQTTGKVDGATLQALDAGGAAQNSHKDNAHKDSSRGRGQAPAAAAPQNEPAAPSTTGQGVPAPASPQPAAQTPPSTPDGLQMPDASSRVPAGAPQEDYKDDSLPSGGDQR